MNFISSFVFHHKMHLHVFIALLFILLTGGFALESYDYEEMEYTFNEPHDKPEESFSLECYQCRESRDELKIPCSKTMRCYTEESRCGSTRRVQYMGGLKQESMEVGCVRASECKSWSFTATPHRSEYSVQCCNTNMCNARPAPALNSQPNGKKCYSCNWEGCSQTVDCIGNENYCFTANEPFSHPMMKGCASEFLCGSSGLLGPHVTCCEGNLCNAVERVSQSLLFLCCSLIFFFLLN
ncbi:urokinase plasminogen activator surface receptor-like [Pimephales promelas]|uniref:urokinase plasminogen activator surface receptor-like n=1 Tax=Pimephales promelas TaxID=90988 RepID=UPI001955899A|nr:urokinase plasminogen activator surface receptor-like [Pimephales promelas]